EKNDPASRLAGIKKQRSLLDYVAGGVDRLQTELGPRDRSKLSEYLDAIRDIERRLQKAEQQNAEQQNAELKLPRFAGSFVSSPVSATPGISPKATLSSRSARTSADAMSSSSSP